MSEIPEEWQEKLDSEIRTGIAYIRGIDYRQEMGGRIEKHEYLIKHWIEFSLITYGLWRKGYIPETSHDFFEEVKTH